jgi:hypothetical protein
VRRVALVAGIIAATLAVVAQAVLATRASAERDRAESALAQASGRVAQLKRMNASSRRASLALMSDLGRARRAVRQRQPCARFDGGPEAVLLPDHGPVGTRVRMVVDCLVGRLERSAVTEPAYGVFLLRDFGTPLACELIAAGPYRLKLVDRNRAAGWFTVASRGGCFQSDGATRAVTPGSYHVGLGCHACFVATFQVTQASQP